MVTCMYINLSILQRRKLINVNYMFYKDGFCFLILSSCLSANLTEALRLLLFRERKLLWKGYFYPQPTSPAFTVAQLCHCEDFGYNKRFHGGQEYVLST